MQPTGEYTMRTGLHPNWSLLSALLALAIGLLIGQAAIAASNQELERIALLLIIYGIVIIWLHTRPAVRKWRTRTIRAIQAWRSSVKNKK